MKETLKSKNGITLIALIITIIILLILAMVTINILINQGIIGHANNAVRGYEVAEEKELIGLGYQNYKMDKLHDSDALLTVDGANGGEGIPKDDDTWYITFDKTGHTYALTDNGNIESIEGGVWTKNNDGSYTKGDVTLKVGDYVAYDPMDNPTGPTTYTSYSVENASSDKNNGRTSGYTEDQTFDASTYTDGWQVLSVKGNKVELIAANSVGYYKLKGQEGYQYGPDEMHAITMAYGKGKGSIQGRNLVVEEINKITGYNPNKTGDGHPYGDGETYEYGNEMTYYWKGDDKPYYTRTNGEAGNLTTKHNNGFDWFDTDGIHHVDKSSTANDTETGREKITTLKSTYYFYYQYSLTTSSSTTGERRGLATDSNEYKVLFYGKSYWLASRCVWCTPHHASFSLRSIDGGRVYYEYRFSSSGETNNASTLGVRPVITLSPKAQIKAESGQDGTTAAKAYSLVVE